MRNVLRNLVYAGAIFVAILAPILVLWPQAASAQVGVTPQGMTFSPFKQADKPPPTPEEAERQRALDEAYKSATKKVPDKKVDPWAVARPTPNSAAAAKQ
jgi:hypothetical protein